MYRQGVGDFKYYVGISSLAQIATRQDRVCVLNILGGESSDVTPVGHEYSGGNVVFGTSPGRGGKVLETKIGNIPVYNNVREGLLDRHRFNCGVIYLPPSAARDGVAELGVVLGELGGVAAAHAGMLLAALYRAGFAAGAISAPSGKLFAADTPSAGAEACL